MNAWSSVTRQTDTHTLRGLLETLVDLDKEQPNPQVMERVREGAATLSQRLSQAIRDTESSAASFPEDSPIQDLFGEAHQAYLAALAVIERLAQGGATELEELCADLQEVEQLVSDSSHLWQDWYYARQPVCATCGYTDSEQASCPDCGCDLLVPDSRELPGAGQQVVLGVEFKTVSDVLGRLSAGQATLQELSRALGPLEQLVNRWHQLAQNGTWEKLEEDLVESLCGSIEQAGDGLDRLLDGIEGRDWSPINDGWSLMLSAGLGIQRELPRLLRATGSADRAEQLEGSYRTRDLV